MQQVDLLPAGKLQQQMKRAFITANIDCKEIAGFGLLRVCRQRINRDHFGVHAAPAK